MNYLDPLDYPSYGLDPTLPDATVAAASALIDAHCRRKSVGATEYTERLRVPYGRNTVRLTYVPLCTPDGSSTAISSVRARYGEPRRGESLPAFGVVSSGGCDPFFAADIALAFGLPGAWTNVDPATIDFCTETGELTLPQNALGLGFNEIEVTYTAGFASVPDAVKFACAQIVRNMQATPALNVKSGAFDRMHLEYFADSLIDASVRSLLAPFVAQKVA